MIGGPLDPHASTRGAVIFLAIIAGDRASLVPLLNLLLPPDFAVPCADLSGGAVRQIRSATRCWRSRSI